jgi:hypothetical protein
VEEKGLNKRERVNCKVKDRKIENERRERDRERYIERDR